MLPSRTAKFGCISRRKPKSQLLDTVTVVTIHPYVACKKQKFRQRKHGQLWTLSTARFRSLWGRSSLQIFLEPTLPYWSIAFVFSALSPKPYFHTLHQSLHAWTPPACSKALFSLQHTSYYPGTTLTGVRVLTAVIKLPTAMAQESNINTLPVLLHRNTLCKERQAHCWYTQNVNCVIKEWLVSIIKG